MAMHKKSFSVDVDDDVSEAFSEQVDERGYIKYRAIEGALCGFMALPPAAQVALMSDSSKAQEILVNSFRHTLLQKDDSLKSPKPTEPSIEDCIENIKQFVKIKLPSPEEQRMISALRKALGPEPKQKRKRG